MIKFFKMNMEPKKRLRMVEVIFSIGLCIASIISIGYGLFDINANIEDIQFKQKYPDDKRYWLRRLQWR